MLNPVLRKELRTSLRTWKIYVSIALHIFIVAGAACLFLWANISNSYYYGFDPQIVMGLYVVMSSFQFILVLITTPALTAGSISGEREKQTLDLLLITKMSPLSIVLGKLMSSLSIVLLMIVGTLPVFAVIFYFGGVSFISLILTTLFLLSISCMVGAISIFMSALLKKTPSAMVITYIFIGFMCFGTIINMALYSTIYFVFIKETPNIIILELIAGANPGLAFCSIMMKQIGGNDFFNYFMGYSSDLMDGYIDFYIINFVYNAIATVISVLLTVMLISSSKRKK